MPNNLDIQSPDAKKQEQNRRTELAMLYLLIEKYPQQARERIRQPANKASPQRKTASL